VSATMEPAAAVEASSTTETAASMETAVPHGPASVSAATRFRASIAATPALATPAFMTPAATSPATPSPATPSPELSRMAPVVPRACADEDAANEVIRPVEAIRRAGVRIVIVIAIRAYWRACSNVARPNPDANSNSNLCLRISHRQHQHRQQRKIFQVTHNHPLLQTSPGLLGGVQKSKTLPGLWPFGLSFSPWSTGPLSLTYLNAGGPKKLLDSGWLISAILLKFNQLGRTSLASC
jgi:hypothetical protein